VNEPSADSFHVQSSFHKKGFIGLERSCALSPKDNKHETLDMTIITGRRSVLRTAALTVATGAISLVSAAAKPATAAAKAALTPAGATHLEALMNRLAQAPRRRDFKTVPMILDHPEQWDHEALTEVLSYQPAAKQAWDNTDIAGPWLNMMSNALNTQIWSFKHPGFSRCFGYTWYSGSCALRSDHLGQVSAHEFGWRRIQDQYADYRAESGGG
jgi:hypothetical protein